MNGRNDFRGGKLFGFDATLVEDFDRDENIKEHIVKFCQDNDPNGKFNFRDKYDVEYIDEIEDNDGCALYVFTNGNVILGFIRVDLFDEYIEVADVIVAKKYRKKGYAWRFIKYAADDFDTTNVRLQVNCKNHNALIAYLKMGFEITGFIKGYYENGDDCLYMRTVIEDGAV